MEKVLVLHHLAEPAWSRTTIALPTPSGGRSLRGRRSTGCCLFTDFPTREDLFLLNTVFCGLFVSLPLLGYKSRLHGLESTSRAMGNHLELGDGLISSIHSLGPQVWVITQPDFISLFCHIGLN